MSFLANMAAAVGSLGGGDLGSPEAAAAREVSKDPARLALSQQEVGTDAGIRDAALRELRGHKKDSDLAGSRAAPILSEAGYQTLRAEEGAPQLAVTPGRSMVAYTVPNLTNSQEFKIEYSGIKPPAQRAAGIEVDPREGIFKLTDRSYSVSVIELDFKSQIEGRLMTSLTQLRSADVRLEYASTFDVDTNLTTHNFRFSIPNVDRPGERIPLTSKDVSVKGELSDEAVRQDIVKQLFTAAEGIKMEFKNPSPETPQPVSLVQAWKEMVEARIEEALHQHVRMSLSDLRGLKSAAAGRMTNERALDDVKGDLGHNEPNYSQTLLPRTLALQIESIPLAVQQLAEKAGASQAMAAEALKRYQTGLAEAQREHEALKGVLREGALEQIINFTGKKIDGDWPKIVRAAERFEAMTLEDIRAQTEQLIGSVRFYQDARASVDAQLGVSISAVPESDYAIKSGPEARNSARAEEALVAAEIKRVEKLVKTATDRTDQAKFDADQVEELEVVVQHYMDRLGRAYREEGYKAALKMGLNLDNLNQYELLVQREAQALAVNQLVSEMRYVREALQARDTLLSGFEDAFGQEIDDLGRRGIDKLGRKIGDVLGF